MRSTLCIPDQSCLRDGAFPADLRPDVVCICIRVFAQAWHPVETSYYNCVTTMTCETLVSKGSNVYVTIYRLIQPSKSVFLWTKYWISDSVFVTTLFELGLCNSDMWTNRFLKLKGMTLCFRMDTFTADVSLFLFFLNSTFNGRCRKFSAGITQAYRLHWYSHVHSRFMAPFQCFPVFWQCKFVRWQRQPQGWSFAWLKSMNTAFRCDRGGNSNQQGRGRYSL